ncbi:MAG: response regulator [Thermodesulfobacteriota bacterium]
MKKKVLVVEDELDMRIFLSTLLETNGFGLVSSKNGREGIQAARTVRPDLIILDLMMPDEGGARMYRTLKEDRELCRIPVLLLSAVPESSFRHFLSMLSLRSDQAVPAPDIYIRKPPDAGDLLSAIRRLLALSSGAGGDGGEKKGGGHGGRPQA